MPDEQREKQLQEKVARLEEKLAQAETQSRTLGLLLEKKLNEMYVQYHVSRTISSQLGKHEMIRSIMDIIKGAIPFDRVSVYLLDDPRENLELSYSSGLGWYKVSAGSGAWFAQCFECMRVCPIATKAPASDPILRGAASRDALDTVRNRA